MISLLNASTGLWVGLGLLAVVLLVVLWVFATYNSFVKLKNNVEEGYATMDVYYKKRYDLVPNLVETVKGYAKHEKETLSNLVELRNSAMSATNSQEKEKKEQALSGALKNLFALAESYPELKANTNFIDLQNQLSNIETDIANARKYYNSVVKMFNTKIEMFPSNLIAKMFKFTKKEMFEVSSSNERESVKVEF